MYSVAGRKRGAKSSLAKSDFDSDSETDGEEEVFQGFLL